MMSWLFNLRGDLNQKQKLILGVFGVIVLMAIWVFLTTAFGYPYEPIIPKSSLPNPLRVLTAYYELVFENKVIMNLCRSIGLNLGGYIKSIIYALVIGFSIGLVPLLRGSVQKMVDAIRFLPLTAVTGLFILWFGIQSEAKINFLAFGIFIYLLPVVIQRIDEVDDVYLKTVKTLGANYFQTIWTVYVPAVLSKLSDDIRILTAISWTYIIVAETTASNGGIGQLIFASQRLGRIDKVFACLIIIMVVGMLQDKIFGYLDRLFFPYKYQVKNSYESKQILKPISYFDIIFDFIMILLTWIFIFGYLLLMLNEFYPLIGDIRPLTYLFSDTLWTIHFVFFLVLFYQAYSFYQKRNKV